MTDNAEREAFEKVWPMPSYLRWHEGRYVSDAINLAKMTESACYKSTWQGWQAGRASGIQHAIAMLKPAADNITDLVSNQSQLGTIFRDGKICQGPINTIKP